MAKKETLVAEVDGRTLTFSNLSKVFYPKTGFTKGEVIDYYARIGPTLLPHLRDRPLTLKRYPDGVEGLFFYQKDAPDHRPPWIRTTPVARGDGTKIQYVVVNDLATLLWLANIANLELHPFQHTRKDLARPTTVAFDLDPGPSADVVTCARVALFLRDALQSTGLQSWVKTSGSKGLQLYVPLNSPLTYDETKAFSRTIAETLSRQHPSLITAIMRKDVRRGRVFIDWSQNDEHKTTSGVYSLRARERPTVSTPVSWKEVESARSLDDLTFTAPEVLDRVKRGGDLFEPVLTKRQRLTGTPHPARSRPRARAARRRPVAVRKRAA